MTSFFKFIARSGFYVRQLREPSLADPSVFILLCEYLNININGTILLSTVLYMDGDSCVDTTATPLLIESMQVEPDESSSSLVNITVPLSDDTRSDFLGAYDLDPTDDTASRYVILVSVSYFKKCGLN